MHTLGETPVIVTKGWLSEQGDDESQFLCPSSAGGRLSADAVQHALAKLWQQHAPSTLRSQKST
jgi:hypothetical protein